MFLKYIVYMFYYEKEVKRSLKKGVLPLKVFKLFNNAFLSLNLTKDSNLFDIEKLEEITNEIITG